VGIILQGFALQPLVRAVGEKGLLVLSFVTGILYNILYKVSKSKKMVYVSLILSQITGLNSSIVSSVASKTVPANQQGRVQGALCALNSIGYAVGSLSVQFVYQETKDISWLGPSFMFVFTASLYAVGTVLVTLIPAKMPYELVEENEQVVEPTEARQISIEARPLNAT